MERVVGHESRRFVRIDIAMASSRQVVQDLFQSGFVSHETACVVPIHDIDMNVDAANADHRFRRLAWPQSGNGMDTDAGKGWDQHRVHAVPWRHENRQAAGKRRDAMTSFGQFRQHDVLWSMRPVFFLPLVRGRVIGMGPAML